LQSALAAGLPAAYLPTSASSLIEQFKSSRVAESELMTVERRHRDMLEAVELVSCIFSYALSSLLISPSLIAP
jgi:hypothetical protein